MTFKEVEGYYYEFRLDMYFVPSTIIDTYDRRTWVANHVNKLMGEFISEKIVKKGLTFSTDRIVLISNNQNDINNMKNFCHFVMKNDSLLNISLNHIIGKFNLDNFKSDLSKLYENYTLNDTLKKELVTQPIQEKKKAKI
jgi:hypothetical protein